MIEGIQPRQDIDILDGSQNCIKFYKQLESKSSQIKTGEIQALGKHCSFNNKVEIITLMHVRFQFSKVFPYPLPHISPYLWASAVCILQYNWIQSERDLKFLKKDDSAVYR